MATSDPDVPAVSARLRTTCASRRSVAALFLTVLLSAWVSAPAQAQTAAPPASAPVPTWRLSAFNTLRLESWRFFDPRPGGGNPDALFLGDRLRLDVRGHWTKVDLTLAAQVVGMAGLPSQAVGPGALGVGALYYDQGGRRANSGQVYLRFANLKFPAVVPGLDITVGRMGYTSGAEAPSGVAKIETVKRQRLDARLVGEFEWSIYQRAFDGVRVDATRPAWRATAVAFMPTQGGFARQGNVSMRKIGVGGVTVSSRPGTGTGAHAQVQGFGWHYRDRRDVTQRPDNTGRTAPNGVDVDVTTVGGVFLGAMPAGAGEFDVLGWGALQTGDWYGDDHSGAAFSAEAGYQWTSAPWRPWLRAGMFRATGDDDPADDKHGTFFPILPTVRRYAQTAAYSTTNLRDLFAQVQARPLPALGLRLDLRRLDLASKADLWYAGSGATLARGNVFGYTGRTSNGQTRLGTVVEASADYAITPRISVNAFAGRMKGGPVVTGTFAGDVLWFTYVESTIALGAR